jgi:hypothetical protein
LNLIEVKEADMTRTGFRSRPPCLGEPASRKNKIDPNPNNSKSDQPLHKDRNDRTTSECLPQPFIGRTPSEFVKALVNKGLRVQRGQQSVIHHADHNQGMTKIIALSLPTSKTKPLKRLI